jgi:hypothetical protein
MVCLSHTAAVADLGGRLHPLDALASRCPGVPPEAHRLLQLQEQLAHCHSSSTVVMLVTATCSV